MHPLRDNKPPGTQQTLFGLQASPNMYGSSSVQPGLLQGYGPATGFPSSGFPGGLGPAPGMTPLYFPGGPNMQPSPVYLPAGPTGFTYPTQVVRMPRPAASAGPMRRHYGAEQAALGVRVNEFHALSPRATAVPAVVALQLQSLWDSGNQLVSLLDDGSWRALSELEPAAGTQVVHEVAEALGNQNVRNVNAYLIAIAKKYFGSNRSAGGTTDVRTATLAGPGFATTAGSAYGGLADLQYGAATQQQLMQGPFLQGMATSTNSASGQKGVPALHKLHGALLQKAQELLEQHQGVLREVHFDEVVVNCLLRLPEPDALEVLHEVGRNELTSVKNISAYIMGIINRIRRQGPSGASSQAAAAAAGLLVRTAGPL